MSRAIEESLYKFPYLSLHIDDFNANNNFIDSKNEALCPFDDSFDEFEMFDELRSTKAQNKIYRINSNVFLISNDSFSESNISSN